MRRPVFVLAHGGWHQADSYCKIIPRLEEVGYICCASNLPSVGALASTKTLLDDVEVIGGVLEEFCNAGQDVILVGHSSGGFIVNEAAKGFLKKDREASGKSGGVIKICLIAAFIPPVKKDTGPFAKVPDIATDWWIIDQEAGTFLPSDPVHLFYNDLSPEEAEHWGSKIQPMHFQAGFQVEWFEAWRYIPTSYLLCENDNAQAPATQEAMIKAAREEGGQIDVERVWSGHSPFLSIPDKSIAWLRRAAGEKVEN